MKDFLSKAPLVFIPFLLIICSQFNIVFGLNTNTDELFTPYGSIYSYKYLNVPSVSQQPYDYACWAACGASISQYYGYNYSKYDFAQKSGNPISKPQSIYVVQSTLGKIGLSSTQSTGLLDFSTIKREVNNNRTMFVNVWGHGVVLEGYSEVSKNDVCFMDPKDGKTYTVEWHTLKDGQNDCSYRWVESIHTIHR